MIFNSKKAVCFLGLILFLNQSFGQINKTRDELLGQINTITTAVPFLLIAPDARAGGMGDYGVATSPDASATHWNPSKLAFADKKVGISISYTPWLRALVNDINLGHVAVYTKLPKDQAFVFIGGENRKEGEDKKMKSEKRLKAFTATNGNNQTKKADR